MSIAKMEEFKTRLRNLEETNKKLQAQVKLLETLVNGLLQQGNKK